MSLSSYNPNNRYKNRSKQRAAAFFRFILMLVFLVGIGFFLGRQFSVGESRDIKSELKTMRAERSGLEEQITDLKAQVQTAKVRHDDLQKAHDELLPEGDVGALIDLLNSKLQSGLSADRLNYILRTAGSPRSCTEPDVKRFVLPTPSFKGPDNKISIADGIIKIKGQGESARNENGDPEAWYDASKKVYVQFISRDTPNEQKKATLPFSHSMVIADKEYRFRVESGAKSFVKITYDVCDYLDDRK